ncbi:hypothetical protein ACVOZ6_004679 [Escherichia coli]
MLVYALLSVVCCLALFMGCMLYRMQQELRQAQDCLAGWKDIESEASLTRTVLTEALLTATENDDQITQLLDELTAAAQDLDLSVGYSRTDSLRRLNLLVAELQARYPMQANSKTVRLLSNNLGDRLTADARRRREVECFSR